MEGVSVNECFGAAGYLIGSLGGGSDNKCDLAIQALFSFPKILQIFSDSPSHRIFGRMHGVLNIDENKN